MAATRDQEGGGGLRARRATRMCRLLAIAIPTSCVVPKEPCATHAPQIPGAALAVLAASGGVYWLLYLPVIPTWPAAWCGVELAKCRCAHNNFLIANAHGN